MSPVGYDRPVPESTSLVDGQARFTGKQDGKFIELHVSFTQSELDAIEAIAKGAIRRVNSSINSN